MKITPTLPSLIIFLFFLQGALAQDYQTQGSGLWHDTHVWGGNTPTYIVLGNKTPSVNAIHELLGTSKLELGRNANGSLNLYNKLTLEEGLRVSKNNWKINVAPGAEFIVLNGVEFFQPSQGDASPVLTINGVARISGGIAGTGVINGSGDLFVDFLGPKINIASTFTGTINITQDPLPIELLSFTAKYQNNQILLKWSTGSEINNDYFTLERSANTLDAEVIGFVEGAGNSSHTMHYQFTDTEPLRGISYYRLKQTDFDGNYEYSDWVAVEAEDLWGPISVTAINQPEGIMLRVFAPTEKPLQVQLLDLNGRVIHTEELSPASPGQVQSFIPMPQNSRSLSLILFRVSDGQEVVSGKIIR